MPRESVIGCTPFVGRTAENRFLRQELELARERGSRLVLLSGPAGMGKTELVRHFLQSTNCAWGIGRGWDNRAAVPYHALLEAIRRVPGSGSDSVLTSADAAASPLGAAPHGCGDLRAGGLPSDLFFRGLAAFLQKHADTGLCLFLDDLQWVDDGTFEWLDFALREMPEVPILWLGAYRTENAGSLRAVLDRCEQWAAAERFAEWELSPLTCEDVETLSRRTVPAPRWRDDLPRMIWERSEGVPLLAVEEIRSVIEDRSGYPRGDGLIRRRLESLGEPDRELLSQAAVIGERFAVEPLAAALQEDALKVAQRLDALKRESGLLVAGEDDFRFSHSRYREALLDGMSPVLRQQYHLRLTRHAHQLHSTERTYHLVQAGEIEQGVEALIGEGDQALDLMDWRDGLRYYQEALLLVKRNGNGAQPFRHVIYERIGDVHLRAAGEPEIARGYYEAALTWTHSPRDSVPLMCRLAETYERSPRAMQHLEDAARLAAQGQNEELQAWVQFLQAEMTPSTSVSDRNRLHRLGRRVLEAAGLPPECRHRAGSWILTNAGHRGDVAAIQRHERVLADVPPQSWAAARLMCDLAEAYRYAGCLRKAVGHMQAALQVFEGLGRNAQAFEARTALGWYALNLGEVEPARAHLQEALRLSLPDRHLPAAYGFLCQTWVHDHHPDGVQWARAMLTTSMASLLECPREDGSLESLLHEFGAVERIFRDTGRAPELHRLLEETECQLRAAGYQTDAVWYLGAAVARLEVAPVASREEWVWTAGSEQATCSSTATGYDLATVPYRGFALMDMPRVLRRVAGNFTLQVTVNAGAEVLADTIRCRREAGEGQPAECAAGAGGLLLIRDQRNNLRLFAHVREPGEVLCEIRRDGRRSTLGRGLLGDGPIQLRLEKKGTAVRAYAGNDGGGWHLCGEADLPDWEELQVGVYGECPTDLYAIVRRSVTRVSGLCLRASAVPEPHAEAGARCPRPERHPDSDLPEIVAESTAMRQILRRLRQVAQDGGSVLVTGETGTGKELVVRALHRLGARSRGPFIPLNCAAIAPDLLERELFGHVRGAYTGAYESHGGLFEAADGGILFLDEIGDASPEFQARLLRVVEEQAVRRVGEPKLRQVDVRIVAATNRDLDREVASGRFRRDLYYRLRGITIDLPPLRERPADIPHLVFLGLDTWARRRQTDCPTIAQATMAALLQHPWPGNVRELFQEVEQAARNAQGDVIAPGHLGLRSAMVGSAPPSDRRQRDVTAITEALRATEGNVSAAARRIGISRATLYRRMQRLGLRTAGNAST